MNGWWVEKLPDGTIIVHWPSGHADGPFTPDEWDEMAADAQDEES